MSKYFLIAALLLAVGAGCTNVTVINPEPSIDNPVIEPEPVDEDETAEIEDLITVSTPFINAEINSPVTVEGEARGNWYFEASFPIKVYDSNQVLLGTGIATAQGDWMTVNFVPFTASITFTPSTTATGTLVLEKDNPSGLPIHDNSLVIPITF
ncbi:MAG: Gmad2 immunoglobulin-like domain-containing protein [Patescibacteria group bacterium]